MLTGYGGAFLSSAEIADIQSDLLEAAVGDLAFVDVVQKIVDYLGGGGGVIFELNRKTGIITDWVTPNLVIGDTGYDHYINSINPRMRYTLRHAPGLVNYEGRFIDDRGIDRHEFYDWLDRFSGFRYFMGSRIYDEGDISVFHSVEFDKRCSHPEKEEIEKFGLIARSVGNAWRLSKRTNQKPVDEEPFPWTPEYLPWSIFALSSDGRYLQANAAGREMLDAKQIVVLIDEVLTATDRRSRQSFANMIQAGLSGVTAEALLWSDDCIPSIAQAVPLGIAEGVQPDRPAALIYIKDPSIPRDNAAATISRLFQLSDAEQNLLTALSNGSALSEAADKLGITRNTARNQLQSVYDKTGTHRQQELLVRILGIANN
jgi:DNA-binding CsgD family transcriptional regulator